MPRKKPRLDQPPKKLASLHVRIDRRIKRELELRAQEEHKKLGALVEEGLRLLEKRRAEYPAELELLRAINERLSRSQAPPK
jgi:hypothetical protein